MSRENVEATRRYVAAYNAGEDLASVRDLFDPTAVMHHLEGWPEPGPSVGPNAILREIARLRETWQRGDRLELVEDLIDVGNRVLGHAKWHVSGRGPDATMEFSVALTFRRGRVILVEYFWDHNEALEAVGLPGSN